MYSYSFCLVLQIGCVSDILASNILTSSIATSNILTQKEDKPLESKILVQSTESSTPFKLLLTGGVIAISMLTDSDATCGDFTINQSDLSFDLLSKQMELSPLCFKPPSTIPCAASNPTTALLNVKFPVSMLLSAILTLQLQSVSYFLLQIGEASERFLCSIYSTCRY